MSTVYIVSAPSGSGKSTLVAEILKTVPNLDFSISYTTRRPRGPEQNRKEYFFVSQQEFDAMVAADEFLEHAIVHGNCYGTASRFLREAEARGHDLLLDIDVQGALQVMKKVPEAVSIFILPPSPQVLEMRLRNRSQAEGVTDEAVIEERLSQARNELRHLSDYKYALINDQLDQAASEMRAIVLHQRGEEGEVAETAARCLTSAHSARLDAALTSFQVSTTIV